MSRHKTCLPEQYVLGSSVVLGDPSPTGRVQPVISATTMQNKGHGDVPYVRKGDVMWRKPKPMALTMHFKTEATRRAVVIRAMEAFNLPADKLTMKQMLSVATPKETKVVPNYRAIPARLANEIRAAHRRKKRIEEERNAGKSLAQRALERLGLGNEESFA